MRVGLDLRLVSHNIIVAVCLLVLVGGCTAGATPAPTPTATALSTSTPVPPTATQLATPTALSTVVADDTSSPTSEPTATATAPPPTPTPEASVQYELIFDATWSAETHPADFPSNAHFSGLIGATHTAEIRLWEVGALAGPGIESMAETGRKRPLDREIEAYIDSGEACELISGDGLERSPGSVSVTFTADVACPFVSVVTMIAPSPDWFVGVSALSLLEDGRWVDEKVVELLPYDAGTDSGPSYASRNDATDPAEPIYQIESAPLAVDGTVPPLGTFTLVHVH